ncbi:MAG: hypothetical protein LPK80_10795 [Bacteroidota bacterium]|nr:hypothetical protein [Bacteroidota bacterium]
MYFGIPAIVSAGDKDRELILDRFPGAFFAWSMQLLSTNFVDPAIRALNSSTLLESDFHPYNYSDPADFQSFKNDLINFSPAILTRILKLYDQSGNGFFLTHSNVSNAGKVKGSDDVFWYTASNASGDIPDNNLLKVEKAFPGIQDEYFTTNYDRTDASLPDLKNGCTLFVLDGSRGTGVRAFFGLNGVRLFSGYKTVAATVVDGSQVLVEESCAKTTQNGLSVICFRLFPNLTYDLTVNGVYSPGTDSPDTTTTFVANRMRFGRELNALPASFKKEVIMYDSALTDSQVNAIINDMRARYGCL